MSISAGMVAAVIPVYHPPKSTLETIKILSDAGLKVVLVINAASEAFVLSAQPIPFLTIIRNEQNVGLATALNQGIRESFRDQNVMFVLLLDQDSRPEIEMPLALARLLVGARLEGIPAACIGPTLVDMKSPSASISVGHRNAISNELESPKTIATSGTLIERSAFAKIGDMLDVLFIDGIDHEWCFRAVSRGLIVLRSLSVTMGHDMGEGAINYFGTFKPIHRSPIRHYYIIRNTICLLKISYVPLGWKTSELMKTFRRVVAYIAFSSNRLLTIKMIAAAIRDGLLGRMGPIDAKKKW